MGRQSWPLRERRDPKDGQGQASDPLLTAPHPQSTGSFRSVRRPHFAQQSHRYNRQYVPRDPHPHPPRKLETRRGLVTTLSGTDAQASEATHARACVDGEQGESGHCWLTLWLPFACHRFPWAARLTPWRLTLRTSSSRSTSSRISAEVRGAASRAWNRGRTALLTLSFLHPARRHPTHQSLRQDGRR